MTHPDSYIYFYTSLQIDLTVFVDSSFVYVCKSESMCAIPAKWPGLTISP